MSRNCPKSLQGDLKRPKAVRKHSKVTLNIRKPNLTLTLSPNPYSLDLKFTVGIAGGYTIAPCEYKGLGMRSLDTLICGNWTSGIFIKMI